MLVLTLINNKIWYVKELKDTLPVVIGLSVWEVDVGFVHCWFKELGN